MRVLLLGLLACAVLCGCGSKPAAVAAPAAPKTVALQQPPACAPNEPDQPSDTSAKLSDFKQALSRCLLIGERPRDPTAMLFIVQVQQDGLVKEASVAEGSTGAALDACAGEALRSLRFASFCGSDVELRWRIHVQ